MFRHGIQGERNGMMTTTCGIPIENNARNPTAMAIIDAMADKTLPSCRDCDRLFAKALGFTQERFNTQMKETW